MDYDWNYYLEDLKAKEKRKWIDKQDREVADFLIYRLVEGKRKQIQRLIRDMLVNYRQQDSVQNAMIEDLMKAHAEYCHLLPDGEMAKRRHNIIVYRYMMKTTLHNNAVALKMGISNKTIYNDINQTIDEIAVLCFGLPMIGDNPLIYQDGIRSLIHNYQLIRQSDRIDRTLVQKDWQQEREEYKRITVKVLGSLKKAVGMYEEFIANSNFPDMQKRRLEAVKKIYFESSSISHMAASYCVSGETIYTDIKVIIGRLAELFVFMSDYN